MEIPGINVAHIAHVCHEANRAYCQTLGDYSQATWVEAAEWQRKSAINGVVFHLDALSNGNIPSPSASHNSWLKEKAADGWNYGPVKDEAKKLHPCYVSYEQLPIEQRLKDYIFGAIVKAHWDAVNGQLD